MRYAVAAAETDFRLMPVLVETDIHRVGEEFGAHLRFSVTKEVFGCIEWFELLATAGLDPALGCRVYIDDATRRGEVPGCFLFCAADADTRWLSGMSNYYSLGFAPLFTTACADRQAALDRILSHMAGERPRWRLYRFGPLDPEGIHAPMFERAVRRAGLVVRRHPSHRNFQAGVTPGDFAGYRARLPSRLRNTLDRRGRRLHRDHRVDVAVTETCEQKAVARYEQVYARSWKPPEPRREFICRLCHTLAELGALRLGILSVDGEPVAAQIWIVATDRAVIYKLAHDPDWDHASPGSILTEAMARHVIDRDRVCMLDFGAGAEPYKADWMDRERVFSEVQAVQLGTLAGTVRALRWLAAPLRHRRADRLSRE